jgi:transcription elongation factor
MVKNQKVTDKEACAHKFQISDKVLISNDFNMGKTPKLGPSFKGPGEIIDINDNNAKVKMGNKIKVLNVNKFKLFLQEKMSETDNELQDLNLNDYN